MDTFHLWHVICMRRMEFIGWELAPPCDGQQEGDMILRNFRVGVARNIDRARHRWQRVQIFPILTEVGPLTFTAGTALQLPSDDGPIPTPRLDFLEAESGISAGGVIR